MYSPIQQPINGRECPRAPTKKRPLTVCLIRSETKRELFPDENYPSTPPQSPRKLVCPDAPKRKRR